MASPAFASVNLITDGDFTELTDGPGQITASAHITTAVGWTTHGYNMVMNVANTAVPTQYGVFTLWDMANGGASTWNGLAANGPIGNFLAMDGDYRTARVSQTVTGLTVGHEYFLDFEYGFAQERTLDGGRYNGATKQALDVFVGNAHTPVWTSPTVDLPSHGFAGWTPGTVRFTADSSSEVVSFLASGSPKVPPFALVGDVSMTAVPEPATWAMMMLGFAGLGVAGFRSTRRKAAIV
jgi:hypothetical protein